MDVTSEYVKQCEKAVEIQNKSPRKDFMDLEFSSGVYFSPDGNRWFRKINGSRVHIWLPRQDQLQMLSGLSWQDFDKECLKYDAPTKEQAGIQVVMGILAKTTMKTKPSIAENAGG